MTSIISQTRKTKMNTWAGLMSNPQISLEKSIEFVKKLTVIAISNITYLRNIFPESAFIDRQLEGLNLKILKGDHSIPAAQQMINWLKSAFEAVNLRYLRKLILVIETEKGNSTLETYTFNFSYNNDTIKCELENEMNGATLSLLSQSDDPPEDVKKSTQKMLRSLLIITQTLPLLPENAEISMRLVYYDEVTPSEYQPKYFRSSDALDFKFPVESYTLKLGNVTSKYHSLALTTKTSYSGATAGELQAQEVNETNATEDDDMLKSSQSTNISQRNVPATPVIEHDCEIGSKKLSESLPVVNLANVKCVCGVNEEGTESMILCTYCGTSQHMACYKLLEGQNVENHVCISCWKTKHHVQGMIDEELTELPENKQKFLALYRRALVYSMNTWRVSSKNIASELGITKQVADSIFERLDKDRVLKPSKGRGSIRTVDRDFLQNSILPKFFNGQGNNESDMELVFDDKEDFKSRPKRGRKQKISRTDSLLQVT